MKVLIRKERREGREGEKGKGINKKESELGGRKMKEKEGRNKRGGRK